MNRKIVLAFLMLMIVQLACGLRTGSSFQEAEIAAGMTQGAPTAIAAYEQTQSAQSLGRSGFTPTPTQKRSWIQIPDFPVIGATATPMPTGTPVPVIGRLTTAGKQGDSWHWFQAEPPSQGTTGYFYDPNAKGIGQITGGITLDVLETGNADHWFKVNIRGWLELADADLEHNMTLCINHRWGHPIDDDNPEGIELCHAHLFLDYNRSSIIGAIQPGVRFNILSQSAEVEQMVFIELTGWVYVDQIVNWDRQQVLRCDIEITCDDAFLPLVRK